MAKTEEDLSTGAREPVRADAEQFFDDARLRAKREGKAFRFLPALEGAFADQRSKGDKEAFSVLAEVAPFVARFAEAGARDEVTGLTGEELYAQICAVLRGRGLQPNRLLPRERERCAQAVCRECARGNVPIRRGGFWYHRIPPLMLALSVLRLGRGLFCPAAPIWNLNRDA